MRHFALVVGGLAMSTMLARPSTAAGQNLIELRGADSKYRYADWNNTWRRTVVVDVFYVGVPGSNEVNVGGGYAFKRGHLVVTPLAYAVAGKEEAQRGIKVAVLLSFDHRAWKVLSFLGHYLPVSGAVERYTVMDALDLTRSVGKRLEVGLQSGFFRAGGAWNAQTGPLVKVNDRYGAWAASYRFGSLHEFRVGRVLTF